ncbi:ABC transporter ATP-binding protein [Thermopolyspora flexuosa]|uniref:Amino acid/amide ABC transporter ATP-binding protein 2 (HAAT family) n=1 Tax=Thermopolyspora flexuosa TaxID=103836 RepID=A0A543J2F6_9ACTN|nr:ABC transporter ATP-binding protein [Thermopolyspora flexuosa]TQM77001.1 amino acid/amide ABC transporter ATP-binding protein 2 (HAAT family) [Thermopolyspora flexuosa]GGM94234.1 ABC transporter ATP-binding protein [Thermopolyspora flexuosa]
MTAPLLRMESVNAYYGRFQALHGVSLEVGEGEAVVLLGANGAGKTTLLRALSGLVRAEGRITFGGTPILGRRPEWIVRRGMSHVPQGRGCFADLTVEENLRVGAFTRRDPAGVARDIRRWYEVFPRLGERRDQPAGQMSGGEQQMLAIARALMSRPRLLLLDEPSLGLARMITEGLFQRLREINERDGTALLLVEQNAELALGLARRAYVIAAGHIERSGPAERLRADDAIRRTYLGL